MIRRKNSTGAGNPNGGTSGVVSCTDTLNVGEAEYPRCSSNPTYGKMPGGPWFLPTVWMGGIG